MAVRRRAQVVGPGPPGLLLVRILVPSLEPGEQDYVVPMSVEAMPPAMRMPGSRPVVVVRRRDVADVEEAGPGEWWLLVQDRVREVLNGLWDPLGTWTASSRSAWASPPTPPQAPPRPRPS